ncbi:MAG: DUF2497 domain-containing protein [Rickettsia endosymbiont of Bryobia graminum]|nr:DUF2497 domain-containing protein [Rickettsia endosymbiont of Bryobia graminum]
MSVQEILKSVKQVINNCDDNDDILELKDIFVEPKIIEKVALESKIEDNLTEEENVKILQESLISDKSVVETTNILQNFSEVVKGEINKGTEKIKTVEDLVVEMIKPQLSGWLDKNLPSLVRELVEKEIQRLIPEDQK